MTTEIGYLSNFLSVRQLLEYLECIDCDSSACDIIEFHRLTYSHFAFYIGDGICVNVTGPDRGMSSSSSSSKNFPKGMKKVERLVDVAGSDYRYNKVRINNCVPLATKLRLEKRPRSEAIDVALKGLKRDHNNRPIVGEAIAYDYNLMGNNCECFATRCKYRCEGFSMQAANSTLSSTMGTLERATSAFRDDLADVIQDPDQNPIVRVSAAGAYAWETAVGWTAYGVKTAFDAVISMLVGFVRLFK